MDEITQTLRKNSKIAIGALAGYWFAGTVIGGVNNLVGNLFPGTAAGKWASVVSGLLVSGGAVWLGANTKQEQLGVAFAGVALGQTIRAGMSAMSS